MKLLAVDGVPVKETQKPSSTAEKIRMLKSAREDFEWYPSTNEILAAFSSDLYKEAKSFSISEGFSCNNYYDSDTKESYNLLSVDSLLDVGAGDGRVFDAIKDKNKGLRFRIKYKYGIEKADAQADDLIRKGIFIIGRDFFQTALIDKQYSVIFSNPPYSIYAEWTLRLLRESSFHIMYLVLPVRWETNKEIARELESFEYKVLGEYDFTHGDREARARVNLIRAEHRIRKYTDHRGFTYKEFEQQDPFERWIKEHIGTFDGLSEKETRDWEVEEKFLKAKHDNTIEQIVDDYTVEMNAMIEGFKAIARLPPSILASIKLNKESIMQIIKDNISSLKKRYWRLAFDKVNAITERLAYDTRSKLLESMEQFNSLDFNAGNIRSVVIWIIENCNEYMKKQTVKLFEHLTHPDYIKAYKSNTHWDKDTWRYSRYNAKYPNGKPEKYMLDYRFVVQSRVGCRGYGDKASVVDDLIIVLRGLGADISPLQKADTGVIQTMQYIEFYDYEKRKTETALECRFYMNGNVHLKINQKLMTKFNVEVARILGWIRSAKDIQDEFEISEAEAVRYWQNPALRMIGASDMKMLTFAGEANA